MPDGHAFLLFGLASAALIAVPGPSVVYIVTRGVRQGRGAGLLAGRLGDSLRTNVRRRLALSRASGGVYVSLGLVAALTGERPRT